MCASSLCAYSFYVTVMSLSQLYRSVSHEFFILLGTVISFQSKENFHLTEPIASRIRQRDTTLRTTADPSLLVESLLDLGLLPLTTYLFLSHLTELCSCRQCFGSRGWVSCAAQSAGTTDSHKVKGLNSPQPFAFLHLYSPTQTYAYC